MRDAAAVHWIDRYHRDGYYAPLRVLSTDEARDCRARLGAFEAKQGPLRGDLRHRAHVFLVWLDELVRNARILDAVETILGENLLVWSSSFFIKEGRDGTHVPWHQDSRAYGARAPDIVTAWVALTDSTVDNGGLEVIPGSHRQRELEHVVRHVPASLLTRRREVALGVDESRATIVPLRAGEMSLHHASLVHGSRPNQTGDRRIGVAIRYVRPPAGRVFDRREPAMLVRGVDVRGSFDPVPRPERDAAPEALARHAALMRPADARPVVHLTAEPWARAVTLRGTLLGRDGQGLILCGPSGSGKSVLAGALVHRGWTSFERDAGPSRNGQEARHAGAERGGSIHAGSSGRVKLAAILLLGRELAASSETRLATLPPAHALLALLPYRECGGPVDLAQGIQELGPLVDAVAAYESISGTDRMVETVERFLDGPSAQLARSDQRGTTVWADVRETLASEAPGPGHDMEAIHDRLHGEANRAR